METPNRIIALFTFDDHIQANIIKTKLDAHGVPCFLSGENLTTLTTPFLTGGIRLHIFEEDRDRVIEVLADESMRKWEEDDLLSCPKCRSKRIITFSKSRMDPGYFVKLLLQLTKTHYCLDCETEFDH